MARTLSDERVRRLLSRLGGDGSESRPIDPDRRQPVHTVYGGAHLFRFDVAPRLGRLALRSLDTHAPDAETFAGAVGLAESAPGLHGAGAGGELVETIHARVRAKLQREPVEDFHVDFEDGYGVRPDGEEDTAATAAAREMARGLSEGVLPPLVGIRIKPLSEVSGARAVRTLDLFVTELVEATGGRLPDGFAVTLPKPERVDQVAALADVLEELEEATGLPAGALRLGLMIETPRVLLDTDGRCALPALVGAARGRCVAAHFGPYDYTAACGIAAHHQSPSHPACDHARQLMQIALAGTPVHLADGPTNILPLPPHRPGDGGELTSAEQRDNRDAVHRAWKLHHDNVRRALAAGFYQGWDLHPAQLPARYAAVFAFYLEALDAAASRLANFLDRAARATATGAVFDDAATGRGLLNFFHRGLACGALTEDDLVSTGLTPEQVRQRSFTAMVPGADD